MIRAFKGLLLGASIGMSWAGIAAAGVSPQEAAQLKSTLTPMGSERAGNADGSIPAWTGGMVTVPAGMAVDAETTPRPDYFAAEKPTLIITKANYRQYSDKLSAGLIGMFETYPDFAIDVYPTHRTFSAPQSWYDNSILNATREVDDPKGLQDGGPTNVYDGVPFPIPHEGVQVMFNHLTRWEAPSLSQSGNWVIDPGGSIVQSETQENWYARPYVDWGTGPGDFGGYATKVVTRQLSPSEVQGGVYLAMGPADFAAVPQLTWQYLAGQRRIRRLPNVGYDTPNDTAEGISFYDQIDGFNQQVDRYDWKLIGKQEMFIPYNNNAIQFYTPAETLKPHFIDPSKVRFELHRIWIVDATLRKGARHVMPHRRFYVDEDSWRVMVADHYDAAGHLWEAGIELIGLAPDLKSFFNFGDVHYNLKGSAWDIVEMPLKGATSRHWFIALPNKPHSYWTVDSVLSEAQR